MAAAKRLVGAHVELAKAELGDIAGEVKRAALFAGLAIAALVLVGFLLPIGLALFLGEWLFGSIGWGVLHGTLFFLAVAVSGVLLALHVGGGAIARDLGIAILVGVAVAVLFGLNLTNLAWTRLGEQLAPGLSADIRPLAVGAGVLAAVFAVVGFIGGARAGGGGGAVGGLIAGAIVGGLLGAFSAIAFGPRVGAALGVTVALLTWIVLLAVDARREIDLDDLKRRFTPDETIETTKETIEWVRRQTPLGRES